jgi:hypothetical protein
VRDADGDGIAEPLEDLSVVQLAHRRDEIPIGVAAAASAIAWWPAVALVALVILSMIRLWVFDPFFGVAGYVLCPRVCQGCEGPFRVATHWTRSSSGKRSSAGGPRSFCPTADNGLRTAPAAEIFARSAEQLAPYELTVAPTAANYLLVLVLLVPWAVRTARREDREGRAELEAIEAALRARAESEDAAIPAPSSPSARSLPARPLLGALAAAIIPLMTIILELLLHRGPR